MDFLGPPMDFLGLPGGYPRDQPGTAGPRASGLVGEETRAGPFRSWRGGLYTVRAEGASRTTWTRRRPTYDHRDIAIVADLRWGGSPGLLGLQGFLGLATPGAPLGSLWTASIKQSTAPCLAFANSIRKWML